MPQLIQNSHTCDQSQSRIFILVQMCSLKIWRRKYKNNKLIFVLLNKYFVLYALAESYNFTEVFTNNKQRFFFCAVMLPNREMRLNVFAPKEQYARAYKRHCENIIIYLLNCVRAQEFGAYTVNVMYTLFCELKTRKKSIDLLLPWAKIQISVLSFKSI